MKDFKQASSLIQAADRDASALRGMEDSDIFADEIFGFHVQQAVEKLQLTEMQPFNMWRHYLKPSDES